MKNNEKSISGAESFVLIICTFEIDKLNSFLANNFLNVNT